jgi:dephospho-CoA kinase
MYLAGLTGGIGSGKSAAAARFRDLGIPVINADKVGHELLQEGGAAVPGVVELFGEACMTQGRVDRERLGALVFHDREAMTRLNRLMHPLVGIEIVKQCADHVADGVPVVLVEAALLADGGERESWMEALVLVVCPEDLRMRRLVEQRGMGEEDVRARMAAQVPPEAKIPLADWVVDNSGTLDHLHAQVDRIAGELRERAG